MISSAICIGIVLFYYWRTIVVSSNRIFDASTTDLDDSPENWLQHTETKHDTLFHDENRTHSSVGLSRASTNDTTAMNNNTTTEANPSNQSLRFYILPSPDIVTVLKPVLNQSKSELWELASEYYQNALNEESAELWLHRGFQRLQAQTSAKNKREADIYVVVGYFHLFSGLLPSEQMWAEKLVPKFYRNIVIDPTKPHLILTPTWNPETSRRVGLHSLVKTLQLGGVSDSNIWSVGFERNVKWQPVPSASQILPIPYVIQQPERDESVQSMTNHEHTIDTAKRMENSIFFAGDPRKHAQEWSGCSRPKLIHALNERLNASSVTKELLLLDKKHRMNQSTYHERMQASEYCLVLCGDTPSSRTLTSAIVEGCIPVRVGSRLRGLCDPPCHDGYGWEVTGPEHPHMPFAEKIPWDSFPEINEADLFGRNENKSSDKTRNNSFPPVLQSMFQQDQEVLGKQDLRDIMDRVRSGFIYGYGDPVTSNDFGGAASYIWDSFVAALQKNQ